MRVSQHRFRPLEQQTQKLYKPQFRLLGQQLTKTLQTFKITCLGAIFFSATEQGSFSSFLGIFTVEKIRSVLSEISKSQLGLQMNFKCKNIQLRIWKNTEQNYFTFLDSSHGVSLSMLFKFLFIANQRSKFQRNRLVVNSV